MLSKLERVRWVAETGYTYWRRPTVDPEPEPAIDSGLGRVPKPLRDILWQAANDIDAEGALGNGRTAFFLSLVAETAEHLE